MYSLLTHSHCGDEILPREDGGPAGISSHPSVCCWFVMWGDVLLGHGDVVHACHIVSHQTPPHSVAKVRITVNASISSTPISTPPPDFALISAGTDARFAMINLDVCADFGVRKVFLRRKR